MAETMVNAMAEHLVRVFHYGVSCRHSIVVQHGIGPATLPRRYCLLLSAYTVVVSQEALLVIRTDPSLDHAPHQGSLL